jgi:hypothetical protein
VRFPDISQRHFVSTEKARAKIRWFIDNLTGEKDDPSLDMELAKAVLEKVAMTKVGMRFGG